MSIIIANHRLHRWLFIFNRFAVINCPYGIEFPPTTTATLSFLLYHLSFSLEPFHRKRDPLPRDIYLNHPHLHMLLKLHDLCRITNELICHLADVHQPILLDAHIHKKRQNG